MSSRDRLCQRLCAVTLLAASMVLADRFAEQYPVLEPLAIILTFLGISIGATLFVWGVIGGG